MHIINFTGDTWLTRTDDGEAHEDALRVADAMGALVQESRPGSTVYVGFDTRPLSVALAREVGEVLAARGVHSLVSDVYCPLPALCEAVRLDGSAFGAIMLTAGNKPEGYFGIRIRMADGSAATTSDSDELEAKIVPELPAARGETELVDLMTPYLERLSSFTTAGCIAEKEPLVVCDPMGGATSGHAARLMGALGARVIEIHGPDEGAEGVHPEVVEPWIDDCEQAVMESGAVCGVAIDGSGERLAIVDESGAAVSPHLMVALLMEHLVRKKGFTGRMVAPIFTSTVVRRQAEHLGMPLTVTPAGYMWMREEMAQEDVVCAGDAIGGVCIPALGLERDALGAAAVLLEAIASEDKPLSRIVKGLEDKLGTMEYGRQDVRMGAGDVQVLRNALPGVNPTEVAGMAVDSVSHPAGALRVGLGDGSWVLVRPSARSPLARVYAEAPARPLRDSLLLWGRSLALSPLGPAGADPGRVV